MKNKQWLTDILSGIEGLESKAWSGFERRKFYFHPFYRVGLSGQSTQSIEALFGKSRVGRFKNFRRNLRKFSWVRAPYLTIKASLPQDSVIFFQDKRQRMIIASPKEEKVLKISISESQLQLLNGEIALLKFLQKTPFKDHTAKLVDHGENWIITSFCSNQDSLLNEKCPEALLLEKMHTLIMNPMQKFYQSYGEKKLGVKGWLAEVSKRIEKHPSREILENILQAITLQKKSLPELELLYVQLHFDLHAGNILRDGDTVSIIDWEVTTPGLVIIDYFDFYRRYLKVDPQENKAFWEFLKGNGEAPPKLRAFIQKFIEWQKQFDVLMPSGSERLVFFLYAIERSCIYFEKWGENRLSDRKGFEFKISQCVRSDKVNL